MNKGSIWTLHLFSAQEKDKKWENQVGGGNLRDFAQRRAGTTVSRLLRFPSLFLVSLTFKFRP